MGEMNTLQKSISILIEWLKFEHTATSNRQLRRENQQGHADWAMTDQPESVQGELECSSKKTEGASRPSTIPELASFYPYRLRTLLLRRGNYE